MSFYLLFYGSLLFFYDFLAFIDYPSLACLEQFKRLQQQIGARKAHWALRVVAFSLVIAGLSVR